MAFNIVFIMFLLPIISKAQDYRISVENASMSDAAKLCTLATPTLRYTSSRVTAEVIIGNALAEGHKLWIGYAQRYTDLIYRGCALVSDLNFSKTSDVPADPGQCFSFCGTQYEYVGLSGNTCYCLTELQNNFDIVTKLGCDNPCGIHYSTLCGNIETPRRASIYAKFTYNSEIASTYEKKDWIES